MVFYGLINMAAWTLELLGLIPKEKSVSLGDK
jgi:hypothetical protein